MRRLLCTEFGDPTLLELVEEAAPEPAGGEVVVHVEVAGVSFVDGLIVRGAYQVKPDLPFTPGNCLVGAVVAVGPGVSDDLVGRRVASVLGGIGGAYSSHVTVPADAVCPVPDQIDSEIAAAAMESYLTVAFAMTHRVAITPGDQVVVLGAGGGIGLAAVDVARSLGANVTAVASTDNKRAAALAAGAVSAIGYDDLKNGVRAATGGGADVVIDPVGGGAAETAFRTLATDGSYCVLGFASGDIPSFPANVVLLRNRTIVGVDWGDWSREVGGTSGNVALLANVFARIATGDLRPPRPTVVGLDAAGEVLQLIADRRAVGKYVLRP